MTVDILNNITGDNCIGVIESSASAPPGDGSLQDVVASACCDVDATKAASYPGTGQTWSNLVAAPADGSPQTAYDHYLGNTSDPSTDDPTFVGSAGSSSAYFSLDGADHFAMSSLTGFVGSMPRTVSGTDFWIAMCLQIPDVGTNTGAWSSHTSISRGCRLNITATESLQLIQRGDAANSTGAPTNIITHSSPACIIVSCPAGGGVVRQWVNSRTATELAIVFGVCTSGSTNVPVIGRRFTNSTSLPAGSLVYSFAMGNGYIDNTAAGLIIDTYNSRHGRTYA